MPYNKLTSEPYSLWECFSKFLTEDLFFIRIVKGFYIRVFTPYCVYTYRNMTLSFIYHHHHCQVTVGQQEMDRKDYKLLKVTFLNFSEFCFLP